MNGNRQLRLYLARKAPYCVEETVCDNGPVTRRDGKYKFTMGRGFIGGTER